MVNTLGWFSADSVLASCLKRRSRSWLLTKSFGNTLIAILAVIRYWLSEVPIMSLPWSFHSLRHVETAQEAIDCVGVALSVRRHHHPWSVQNACGIGWR